MSDMMRVYCVEPCEGCNIYVDEKAARVVEFVRDMLPELSPGDSITITAKDMSAEAFAGLPEYQGP